MHNASIHVDTVTARFGVVFEVVTYYLFDRKKLMEEMIDKAERTLPTFSMEASERRLRITFVPSHPAAISGEIDLFEQTINRIESRIARVLEADRLRELLRAEL